MIILLYYIAFYIVFDLIKFAICKTVFHSVCPLSSDQLVDTL